MATQAPILVVEDDRNIRDLVQVVLQEDGYTVTTAADGPTAIKRISENQPAAVLLDMGLPGVDGNGVADALHSRYGDTVPIVVMTAEREPQQEADSVQACACLAKPFNLNELSEAVRLAVSAKKPRQHDGQRGSGGG